MEASAMFCSNVPLKDVVRSRENNLSIIRFIAASMVLVSHSYALYTGNSATEPWRQTLGMSMGGVAVDIFFCVSGFLVAGSLVTSQSVRDFLIARTLRIYPGLWVALLLTVVVLGLLESKNSATDFFFASETWKYLAKNAIMLLGSASHLPGVFDGNPWKGAVNGSLWTLPLELRAYLALLAVWVAACSLRSISGFAFARACAISAVVASSYAIYAFWIGQPDRFVSLLAIFLLGATYRLCNSRIVLNAWAMLAVFSMLGLSLILLSKAFWPLYLIFFPYIIFCLVYLPGGFVRKFNEIGDYSYGIYIYAFPVQQFLMTGYVSSVSGLIFTSFLLTLLFAVASWHGVEKRALALRERTRKG